MYKCCTGAQLIFDGGVCGLSARRTLDLDGKTRDLPCAKLRTVEIELARLIIRSLLVQYLSF